MNSIELGRAVYGPAVVPYIVGAAIARFMVALGDNAPLPVLHDGLVYSGWTMIALCLVVMAFEMIAQWRNHQRILDREDANTALIVAPEPEPEPAPAPPAPPRVPFPPYAFVQFVWDYYEAEGKLPTVDVCEQGWNGRGGFNRQLITEWFARMVDAGYIANRKERHSAGEPTRTRAEFEAAAVAYNTIRET